MHFKSVHIYNYIKNINIYKIIWLILVLMNDKRYITIMLKRLILGCKLFAYYFVYVW